MVSCVHHHNIRENGLTTPKHPVLHPFTPDLLAITDFCPVSVILPLPQCHIVGQIYFNLHDNPVAGKRGYI